MNFPEIPRFTLLKHVPTVQTGSTSSERRYSFKREDGRMPYSHDGKASWVRTKEEAIRIGGSFNAKSILTLEQGPSGLWFVAKEEPIE